MNALRSYFNRIQGRLLAAFMIGFIGTLAIYRVADQSLDDFTQQVTQRIDDLTLRTQIAARFEGVVADQIAQGQRLLLLSDAAALEELDSIADEARALHTAYLEVPTLTDVERNQLDRVRVLHTRLTREYDEVAALVAQGNATGALERLRQLEPTIQELRANHRAVKAGELTAVDQASAEFRASVAERQGFLLLLLGVSTVIGILFAYFTLYTIEKPLHRLVIAADQFGSGDLTVSVNGRMPEEFRVLAGSFTGMAARIRTIVGETVETANRITASASDLSSVSEEVAASSGEVSTAMVDITSGAEEQALGLRTADDALKRPIADHFV